MPARSLEEQARELFAPLGPTYDRVGAALSLGQEPLGRRFASRLPHGGHVLDVATGTGLVAAELLRRGFEVTGLDLSPEMLAVAHRRFGDEVALINGSAEALPLASESFDHLTVTHVLRYVADPGATLAELARRASGWRCRRARVRRAAGSSLARSGTSTSDRGAAARRPPAPAGLAGGRRLPGRVDPRLLGAPPARAPAPVVAHGGPPRGRGAAAEPRHRRRHLGTEAVSPPDRAAEGGTTRAVPPVSRPAWYALERGGWRDYVTLLHPPTRPGICRTSSSAAAWRPPAPGNRSHPSAPGNGSAPPSPRLRPRRRRRAHALDELNGRPGRRRSPIGCSWARQRLDPGRLLDRRRGRGYLRGLARPAHPPRALPGAGVQP